MTAMGMVLVACLPRVPDVPEDDHVRRVDEFRGKVGESLELAIGEFEFEHEVALDVAKVPQALDEGIDLRPGIPAR
jgi:hypothetical protein